MEIRDLKKIVDSIVENLRENENPRVAVRIEKSGVLGPSPSADVKAAGLGFDWDYNTFILYTDKKLQEVEEEKK